MNDQPRNVSRDRFIKALETMGGLTEHGFEEVMNAFDEAVSQTPGYWAEDSKPSKIKSVSKRAIDVYCLLMGTYILAGRKDLAERIGDGAGMIKACLDDYLGEPRLVLRTLSQLREKLVSEQQGFGDQDRNAGRIQGVDDAVYSLKYGLYR